MTSRILAGTLACAALSTTLHAQGARSSAPPAPAAGARPLDCAVVDTLPAGHEMVRAGKLLRHCLWNGTVTVTERWVLKDSSEERSEQPPYITTTHREEQLIDRRVALRVAAGDATGQVTGSGNHGTRQLTVAPCYDGEDATRTTNEYNGVITIGGGGNARFHVRLRPDGSYRLEIGAPTANHTYSGRKVDTEETTCESRPPERSEKVVAGTPTPVPGDRYSATGRATAGARALSGTWTTPQPIVLSDEGREIRRTYTIEWRLTRGEP